MLLRKPGTKDEFDELEKVAGQEFQYEYPQKKKEDPAAASKWMHDWLLIYWILAIDYFVVKNILT